MTNEYKAMEMTVNLDKLLPETQERIIKGMQEFTEEGRLLQQRIEIFLRDEMTRDALLRADGVIYKTTEE